MKTALMLALLVSQVHSATRVTGTIHSADGSPPTGMVLVTWSTFTAADVVFKGSSLAIPITAGFLDAALQPGYYSLQWGGFQKVETIWLYVPPSPPSVSLADCILTDLTKLPSTAIAQSGAAPGQLLSWTGSSWAPTSITALGQIPISQVSGLTAALGSKSPTPYTATITASTSVSIAASTHGFTTPALTVTCYDGATSQATEPDTISVSVSTLTVTITFAEPFTGRCLLR